MRLLNEKIGNHRAIAADTSHCLLLEQFAQDMSKIFQFMAATQYRLIAGATLFEIADGTTLDVSLVMALLCAGPFVRTESGPSFREADFVFWPDTYYPNTSACTEAAVSVQGHWDAFGVAYWRAV
jgi:hypothetical protein